MPKDVKILTNRKGFEFATDGICLPVIATRPIMDHIQQLFQFQLVTIGSPMPTFGEVLNTFPPGVIFDHGVAFLAEKHMIPIRFLHFDSQRMVIDATGDSAAINTIMKQIVDLVNEVQTSSGEPVIGKPEQTLNYSELSAQFSFPLDTLLVPALRQVLQKALHGPESEKEGQNNPPLALTFTLSPLAPSNSDPSKTTPIPFTFTTRTGTQPEEHIYFSSAPLDAETHTAYLNELETALTAH